MIELFDDINDAAHSSFSITNNTSSDLSIFLGQYGDQKNVFNFLTGSYCNGDVSNPLDGPLTFSVPAGETHAVPQGPSLFELAPSILVTKSSGWQNKQTQYVNFGVAVNGTALNPPPLSFMVDDGTFYTTVYGGIGQVNSWTSAQVNGTAYKISMQGGGKHGTFDTEDTGVLDSFYFFNILIQQR